MPEQKYHRVSLKPAGGHTVAPFMDQPRIFACELHEARAAFMAHYGIIAMPHDVDVEPATEDAFAAQECGE